MSGPRPIHSKLRPINDKPSASEPSYSYEEDNLFLNDDFMSVAERFHNKRGEYYSYTPHPSVISGASTAAGRVGKGCPKPRSSGVVGGDHSSTTQPMSPHAKDPHSRKLQFSRVDNDSNAVGSDQRKVRTSQSFNEIVMVENSDLHNGLPRSTKSFSSFSPPLCGMSERERDESNTSTISSLTQDNLTAVDASLRQLDVGGDSVLRLPQTPTFVWDNSEDTLKACSFSGNDLLSPAGAARAQHQFVRKDSYSSLGRRDAKREAKKRTKARMYKHCALEGSLEFGHDSVGGTLDESSMGMASTYSTGTSLGDVSEDSFSTLQGKRLDYVKEKLFYTINAPGKKKLTLRDLNLTSKEVPLDVICSPPLGSHLLKLCLAGNNMKYPPPRIVTDLAGLRTLDLQQCGLLSLPDQKWDLPNLRKLDLGHNRLKSFLTQGALEGLLRLEHLDLNNNEICEWTIPAGECLSHLEYLNIEYNEIIEVPAEITELERLRFLKVSNNQITHIQEGLCKMHVLKDLLVIPNPLVQPPSEECEQGIEGMRRYYVGLAKVKTSRASAAQRRLSRKEGREKRKLRKMALLKASQEDLNDETARTSNASIGGEFVDRAEILSDKAYDSMRESLGSSVASNASLETCPPDTEQEVNDTLRIIVVGMSSVGKSTIIKRLKDGPAVEIPNREERTIGVDINEWDPNFDSDTNASNHCNTKIVQEGNTTEGGEAHIKFSVWDFAGQDVYHATHEIFFSPNALYVLVWDMAAHNKQVLRRPKVVDIDDGWEDSSDEEYDEIYTERELLRADRALEKDIDEKVQYWVNCIQSRVPGAAILPVASFDDVFDKIENGGPEEAQRRVGKMKERLIHHEKRRIEGLNDRLQLLKNSHRADSQEASRIRELLSPFHRPKIIFGNDESAFIVPRVSGLDSRGFKNLRAHIIDIATGRHLPEGMSYPVFRGHVGSPIPPIRIQIRDFIRQKKAEKKFHVIELRYFLSMLTDYLGLEADHEQVGDALRFLSRIGELSFFGGLDSVTMQASPQAQSLLNHSREGEINDESSDEEDASGCVQVHRSNNQAHESDTEFSGLGQFLFISPKWLAATLGCILRHDLKQQIEETRYEIERSIEPSLRWQGVGRGASFHDANKNCPVITAADACMLWKARKKIRKAAERSIISGHHSQACPFTFMQGLLVHFSIFVPIYLNIDKALLGGTDFSTSCNGDHSGGEAQRFFFLPSQLSPWNPEDKVWTYKSNDPWKTCICHSWVFPDGSPPGLFEHVTASVLRDLYGVTSDDKAKAKSIGVAIPSTDEQIGKFRFKDILCWKTAFNIILGKSYVTEDGDLMESMVEIWVHLVDQHSQYCVAGEATAVGMRRLLVSAKGLEGNGCRKIWDGGYGLVLKAVERVIGEYGGLEHVKQGVCSQCLATRGVRNAKVWNWTCVQDAMRRGPGTITCDNGHRVDIRHIGGQIRLPRTLSEEPDQFHTNSKVPFSDLCGGVVLVGLWDGEENRVVAAGSGFVVDNKRGLIVTASHILIDMENGESFGSDYFGLARGRAVIGVIPTSKRAQRRSIGPQAFFRYFAEIVAKSPRNMDACVLRINAKIKKDVGGDGSGCGRYLSDSLPQSKECLVEDLQKLRPTKNCEYEEAVRIIGYSQGGEGLVNSPRLNRVIEIVNGNICKIHDARELYHKSQMHQDFFRPFMEIVVGNCPTIGGQSGGPCVNQSGKVIGILSRSDPEDKSRCYLVPASAFMELVNVAKSWDDYQSCKGDV
uniref:Roc domain-containing protein n=1 Tax=Odontella aurita TaxID=265563 RepID=A0A7S4J5Y0_9STRA|mmetsp:Transcript_39421/g.118381  ORF Transcript_39421/g.118381 Transcript_39421/m.118381 type:complete len:1745 (+) Transcript_39421:288-5522(+)|eukprot:CAMPEP_0113546338 /NCGR_PEP_ID=MMETSP0015_2-20120614/11749_1 /TAXON_ID=2838 /ORGANISM="Odontella" /LENGTH=1744 /DNA_ID=CAMNT_0000446779 /DNA_START=210 /DNA_END=5444 /DNA_ORIENTATION=- /assembly_acc=CAM_ASM_000160